jgi:hypothetical protein
MLHITSSWLMCISLAQKWIALFLLLLKVAKAGRAGEINLIWKSRYYVLKPFYLFQAHVYLFGTKRNSSVCAMALPDSLPMTPNNWLGFQKGAKAGRAGIIWLSESYYVVYLFQAHVCCFDTKRNSSVCIKSPKVAKADRVGLFLPKKLVKFGNQANKIH